MTPVPIKNYNLNTYFTIWNPSDPIWFGPLSWLATVEARPEMYIRIKSACFDPGDYVYITICEDDYPLAEAIANDCGAFEVTAFLPGVPPLSYGPVSVKAWVYNADIEDYELQACWPLDIVYENDFVDDWYEWWDYITYEGPIL